MIKKAATAVIAATTLSSALFAYPVFSEVEETGTSDPVKIMCIGDSITDGYGVAGSYRKFLYHNLTEKGYDIDMVGSNSNSDWRPTYTDEVTGEKLFI